MASSPSNGNGSGQRTGWQAACGGHALDPLQRDVALVRAAEAAEGLAAGEVAREHRHPLGRHRHDLQDPLGDEVGLGAREIEVEGGRLRRSPVDQPAVGRARGLHDGLRQRRVTVHDPRDLGEPALEVLDVDELLDELGGARADDVPAEQLSPYCCRSTIFTSPVRSP